MDQITCKREQPNADTCIEFKCKVYDKNKKYDPNLSTLGHYKRVPFFSTYGLWETETEQSIVYKIKNDELYYVKQDLDNVYTIINDALRIVDEKKEIINQMGKLLTNTVGKDFSKDNVFLTKLSDAFQIAPTFDTLVRNIKTKTEGKGQDVATIGLPGKVKTQINDITEFTSTSPLNNTELSTEREKIIKIIKNDDYSNNEIGQQLLDKLRNSINGTYKSTDLLNENNIGFTSEKIKLIKQLLNALHSVNYFSNANNTSLLWRPHFWAMKNKLQHYKAEKKETIKIEPKINVFDNNSAISGEGELSIYDNDFKLIATKNINALSIHDCHVSDATDFGLTELLKSYKNSIIYIVWLWKQPKL